MGLKAVAIVLAASAGLAACQTPFSNSSTTNGAIIGGATGAAIGAVATRSAGGALVGAGVGALAGAAIGSQYERTCAYKDRRGRVYYARC
ncbi:MAG: glycine zipper domain-containing protein [Bauldia sp.]